MLIGGKLKANSCGKFLRRNIGGSAAGIVAGSIAVFSVVFNLGAVCFAEDATDFSITVNPSINLRVSSSNVGFEITPSKTGVYNSVSFDVYSSTNSAAGYTLTMSTDNVDLASNTVNPTTGTSPLIPTLTETTEGISATDFAATTDATILNHYGVAIDAANFNAMKAEKEIKKTTTNNTAEDTTAISLASKLDLNTVPGVYSTTINFQLVANPIDPAQPYPEDPCITNPDCDATSGTTLQRAYEIAYTNAHKGMYEEDEPGSGTYHYVDSWNGQQYEGNGRDVRFLIQDMTPEICNTATVIGSQTVVLDIRDQTSYYIVKAADGRCWMQDNLALDLLAENANTKITPENTNADALSLNALFNGGRVSGDANTDNLATAPVTDWVWTGSNNYSYSAPLVNLADKDTVSVDTLDTEGGWKVGGYYNYCAASAGSYCYGNTALYGAPVDREGTAIDSEYDICPAGWRMPTGYSYDTANRPDGGEYQALYDAYPSTSDGDNQHTKVRKALRLPLSGHFSGSSSASSQSQSGNFWSSTYRDEYRMYLLIASSTISPQGSSYRRFYGYSVRCIAKTGTESTSN